MWSNRVFILSSLWFSLSFTFNCLHKHEKQCRQNFAVVIFIYYGPMMANVECCCKFRGLLHGKYHYIYIYIIYIYIYIYIYIFLVNQLISLKNTAQFHWCHALSQRNVAFYATTTWSRSSHWRCSAKNGVLKKNFKFHRKTCVLNLCKACNFITKQLQHKCFCVKFVTFLRTPILEKICKWLLLWGICFTK